MYYFTSRHHDYDTFLEEMTHFWFGNEIHTPLVCASPRIVVENGLVQLDEDEEWKVWCEGVEDIWYCFTSVSVGMGREE